MDVFAAVDIYCERVAPGLWGEPLNAATNLAFLAAAAALWRRHRNDADGRRGALLVALVGLGSFAFHTRAQVWAGWLDTGLIMVFMLFYLYRLARRGFGLSAVQAGAGLASFVVADQIVQRALALPMLHGSQAYLTALATLALLAAGAHARRLPAARWLAGAGAVFVISLALRTADLHLCAHWPWGTHFGWHLANALVLYLLVRALVALR